MQIQPSQFGSLNARVSGSIFRPRIMLIAGGIAYETPSATTDAETMALNALEEPRKIQPKMMTNPVVNNNALTGVSRAGCTLAKIRENGSPPSRAKAHVIRLEVDMIPIVAKRRQPSGNMSKQVAPARLLVASYRISRRGPAAEELTASTSVRTKRRTERKIQPVTIPITMQ